jgi:hypothetical protein
LGAKRALSKKRFLLAFKNTGGPKKVAEAKSAERARVLKVLKERKKSLSVKSVLTISLSFPNYKKIIFEIFHVKLQAG